MAIAPINYATIQRTADIETFKNQQDTKPMVDQQNIQVQVDHREDVLHHQVIHPEENEQLDQTEYTQAAMVTACLAMTAEIEKRGLTPDVTAGLSLGEYCAISAAGGMQPKDAISLVRKRGILMQNTVPTGEGAMAAILGLDGETVEKVTEEIPGASVANYNCPGQIVITGEETAVAAAWWICPRPARRSATQRRPARCRRPAHGPALKCRSECGFSPLWC